MGVAAVGTRWFGGGFSFGSELLFVVFCLGARYWHKEDGPHGARSTQD